MASVKYNKMTKADLIEELLRLQKKNKKLEGSKPSGTKLNDKAKEKSVAEAEKILEESEQNYRSLIESSLNAIYVLQDDKLVLVNPAWEELFGYSSDEVLNRTFDPTIVIAPNSHQVYENKRLASKLNIPFNPRFDLQGLTKSGKVIDLEAIVTEIFWNGKKAIQGIYRDITERKRIEEALRREAFIFDNLYDAVIISDLDGFIMNWNTAATRMFGYSKNEILNKNINILNKDDNNFIERIIQSVETDGKWTGEITFKGKDGSSGISETIIFPFLDAHGEKIALVSVNKDITKKKESEQELKESEDKFRKIAENSLVGMYIIQDGIFKYVNSRFAEITGYKIEELVDLIGPLETTALESYHIVEKNIDNRINGKLENIQYEFKIVKKDKSIIDVKAFGSSIM
ncbi:MAG: PAS domain S-box protein, partial [Ignavibacteriaceae bacterium]|nr:PAS domain S-box protein [Ignavibacteriaceae bacterium]